MATVKGGVKDRLKAWFIFQKYKRIKKKKRLLELKKKRQEELLKKKKVYNKFQIFTLTIFGLFIGLFENKANKKSVRNYKISSVEIEKIELRIKEIEEEIKKDNFTSGEKEELIVLKSKLDGFRKDKEKIVDNKKQKSIISNNFVNKDENQKILTNRIDNCYQKANELLNIVLEKEKIKVDDSQIIIIKQEEKSILPNVKKITSDIKELDKKVKVVEANIKNSNQYNDFYELEYKLKLYKIKLKELKKEYEELREHPNFNELREILSIEDIDIYFLRKSSSEIDKRIEKIDESLKVINDKKNKIFNNSEKKPSEVVKEKRNAKKGLENNKDKIKKKRPLKELDELELASLVIMDNLLKEKRKLNSIQIRLSTMPSRYRKRTIFSYAKGFATSILKFGISLLPFKLFKNKLLGTLTSGIMINNSLKSMRKMFSPYDETIVYSMYNDLVLQMKSKTDYLFGIESICYDSLNEIKSIKSMVNNQYGNDYLYTEELKEFMNKINSIENLIVKEREKVNEMQDNLHYDYVKNKQKIKKIEDTIK